MGGPAELILYVVYTGPYDYPGKWVVRRQRVTQGRVEAELQPWACVDTLDAARQSIPQGLHRLPHQEGEDPVIWETWF